MTTDLDGKPVLLLKEDDVRSLKEQRPSAALIARLDKFLEGCATHVASPAFGTLSNRTSPPA